MLKEEIKKRLDDKISEIFTDLQNEFDLSPEIEDVAEGCRRAYYVEQIAESILNETIFDIKTQSWVKGEANA